MFFCTDEKEVNAQVDRAVAEPTSCLLVSEVLHIDVYIPHLHET
jgi:hypothetical protein